MEPCTGNSALPPSRQHGPTNFLQCQRCKGFILSETSTTKRMHNVKCLSYAIEDANRRSVGVEGNCEFQGFVSKPFKRVDIKVIKLSDAEMREYQTKTDTTRRRGRPKVDADSRDVVEVLTESGAGDSGDRDANVKEVSRDDEDGRCEEIVMGNQTLVTSKLPEVPARKRRGRPSGVKNRNGVERANIIKEPRSRISEAKINNLKTENNAYKQGKMEGGTKGQLMSANTGETAICGQIKKRRGRPPGGVRKQVGIKVSSNEQKSGEVQERRGNRITSKTIPDKANERKIPQQSKIFGKRRRGRPRQILTRVRAINNDKKSSEVNNESERYVTTSCEKALTQVNQKRKCPWLRGKQQGAKHRDGIDLTNIIESKRSRRSCLKAKAKFKEASTDSAPEQSGDDSLYSDASDTGSEIYLEDGRLRRKGGPGRKKKYLKPLTSHEKYLLYTKKISLEAIRANHYDQMVRQETRGRKKKYTVPLTNQEKYLFYMKKLSLEDIKAGKFRVMKKRRRFKCLEAPYKKVNCAFCNEKVRENFLEMHVTHFHTEGHDQAKCECDLRNCLSFAPPNVSKKIMCNKCGKMLESRGMRKHLILHEKGLIKRKHFVGNITCAVCQSNVASFKGLKTHFIAFHMESTPFVCKFPGCTYKGGEYYHLERHVGTHLRESRLECKRCGSKFAKLESLLRHRSFVCDGDETKTKEDLMTPPQNTEELSGSEGVPTKNMHEHVKTESVINIGSINLHDKIIETEHGPVHMNGESLDDFPETNTVKLEACSLQPKNVGEGLEKDEKIEKPIIGIKEWDETKVREAAFNLITSWNDKLQDVGYINATIRQDPLFQKLEKENEEFTKNILRGGGRRNYFMVHKTTSNFAHRCDICSKGFRRSWALIKHKNDKVCQFLLENGEATEKPQESSGQGDHSDNSNSTSGSALLGNSIQINSLKFMCAGCGFKSDSALELEEHMKSWPLHVKEKDWWNGKHICPRNCGAGFSTLQQLHEHIDKIHLKEHTEKCKLCPRTFATKKNLHSHVYNYHRNRNPNFICKNCGKRYQMRENYEHHISECKVEYRRPVCQECKEHFSNSHTLRRHIALVHAGKPFSSNLASESESSVRDYDNPENVDFSATDPLNTDSMILGF